LLENDRYDSPNRQDDQGPAMQQFVKIGFFEIEGTQGAPVSKLCRTRSIPFRIQSGLIREISELEKVRLNLIHLLGFRNFLLKSRSIGRTDISLIG